MAKLKVMCARSMHLIVGELGAAFGKARGHEIEFDFGTVGGLETKIAAGETADVYILSVGGIGKMEKAGAVDRKSTRLNSSHIPLSRMPSSA